MPAAVTMLGVRPALGKGAHDRLKAAAERAVEVLGVFHRERGVRSRSSVRRTSASAGCKDWTDWRRDAGADHVGGERDQSAGKGVQEPVVAGDDDGEAYDDRVQGEQDLRASGCG